MATPPRLCQHNHYYRKEKKDYMFRRRLNEKPGNIPGCTVLEQTVLLIITSTNRLMD